KIIKEAKKNNIFVWLDMENYNYVNDTVSLYLKYNKIGNTGICLQSYLKRTYSDLLKIIKSKGIIRLVKGAYKESSLISYNREDSTKNYIYLMEYLFKNSNNFTIATHDFNIIKYSFELSKKFNKKPKYAMLFGIRNKLAKNIAKQHEMSLYLPFGVDWIGYSYRRLKESSNLKLVLRSLLENQKI
ncbi:MAG: proline dehydrogenase family protein, partial [Candidatus Micrarchaeaceae archaeon]